MNGRLPSALEDRGPDDGRRSFGDAPEIVSREQAKQSEPEISPDLVNAYGVAAEQGARADAAEAAALSLYEDQLNTIYSTPFEELGHAPEEVAGAFASAPDGSWRLGAFLSEWAEEDAVSADQWIENAQAALGSQIVSNTQEQLQADRDAYAAERSGAVEQFVDRHPELNDATLSSQLVQMVAPLVPGITTATPEQLPSLLNTTLEAAKQTERAVERAEGVENLRHAFRERAAFDRGKDPSEVPPAGTVSAEALTSRINLETKQQKAARRTAEVERFRQDFYDSGRSAFGGGSIA